MHDTPAETNVQLTKDENRPPQIDEFQYGSLKGCNDVALRFVVLAFSA